MNNKNHKTSAKKMTFVPRNMMVTGGCGFIGSNFIHYLFKKTDFSGTVLNVDKLTYAGNPENLREISERYGNHKYFFEKIDICDFDKISAAIQKYNIDTIIHFAAESHVDRSIFGPGEFIHTNITGTFNLLEASRQFWKDKGKALFHQVSTDEVFGSLGNEGTFSESNPYKPHSPYAASKAAADLLVLSYYHTYKLQVKISNSSNNYGPFQFPEKLIPLMILNALEGKKLPIYGDGTNIRDWIYVEDHCEAIWAIITRGQTGETYNVGGQTEMQNIDMVRWICEIIAKYHPASKNPNLNTPHRQIQDGCQDDLACYKSLITFVEDRPGHDKRYSVDIAKIKAELGWKPRTKIEDGLEKTVQWYLQHKQWIDNVKSGEYRHWIAKNYGLRSLLSK